MSGVGKYFQNTYDTITDTMFDNSEEDDTEYEFREASTERRAKKKNTLLKNKYTPRPPTNDIQEKSKRWYDKFFFGSHEETITAPPPTETTTESRFFNWFGGQKNEAPVKVETVETTSMKTHSGK